MHIGLLILFILFWFGSGLGSYLYWREKKNDITVGALVLAIISSPLGPFVFLFGWFLFWISDPWGYEPIVLMKSRTPSKSVDIDEK
jgi:hypothetical protein